MTKEELIGQVFHKNSMLCVGLDTDMNKLPEGIEKSLNGILEFNRNIIHATKQYAVAYKINTAFYEQYGSKGWQCMEETLKAIPVDCFSIADAKRGDIGNTSAMYAKAFFETMNFDAVTVAPYMGKDSLLPFFSFEGKWVICLGLTSNQGSLDFQMLETGKMRLFEKVIKTASKWGNPENLMFVAGATKAGDLRGIRELLPDSFLLVPGVGAQGGTIEEVCKNAMTGFGGLLINASRSILYAGSGKDYLEKAGSEARTLQESCAEALRGRNTA